MSEIVKENSKAVQDGVFVGQFEHALDPKKRLTIPCEWRHALGESQVVYVFPNAEGCLDLVPKADMDQRLAKLRETRLFDKRVNQLLMQIGSLAEQCTLDKQGRLRICDRLLSYAGLSAKVVLCGSVRMMRLWAPERIAPVEVLDINAFDTAIEELAF